jgi:hypothetical protein
MVIFQLLNSKKVQQLVCITCLLLLNTKLIAKESWIEKTNKCLRIYDTILSHAEGNRNIDSVLFFELRNQLKFSKRQIIAALPQLDTILSNKGKESKTKKLLDSTFEKAYFTRSFNGPYGTTMVYRFSKPNKWGMGLAYLSDRYNNAYFLKRISQNSFSFINDSIIYFPRIYYLHGDSINILGSNLDMYERKVFAPLKNNHNSFEKIYTYYSRNNDRIENLNYHFSLDYFNEDDKKLGNLLASQVQSNNLSTSDVDNFVDYNSLKELSKQKQLDKGDEILDTTRLSVVNAWFYAGTINEKQEWLQNFTNINAYQDLWEMLKDTSKHLNTNGELYARIKPPENYSNVQSKEQGKGRIVGSIYPKDEVLILSIKEVTDFKNNRAVWLQIRRIKRVRK